ncbi:hypothetical protein [Halosimplex salinum]|uniref:hypothetical protein n=1 Tax=Halosimplex salinum TaxID=1710538 RepID=UPI000F4AA8A2|nr:hypothetical protein [Halosimplex salinum]
MDTWTRDALLATASGGALLASLAITESLSLLGRPAVAVAGVAAALAVETLFVADTPAAELWERAPVRTASVLLIVGAGALAVRAGGLWLVAAACWGLATYFVLLGLLVTGLWRPAES